MTLWLLLTLAGAYLLAVHPQLAQQRKRLAERWTFFRKLTSCLPCSCAWPGAFAAAALHERAFVPPWFEASVPWFVTDAIVPVVAFFCGMAVGYAVEALSPLKAAVYVQMVNRGEK